MAQKKSAPKAKKQSELRIPEAQKAIGLVLEAQELIKQAGAVLDKAPVNDAYTSARLEPMLQQMEAWVKLAENHFSVGE